MDRRERQRMASANSATVMASPQRAAPAFVKLASAAGVPTAPAIEVVLCERRLLRVHPGFDADVLRQLVRLLEEPSC
jgi:hypothetical protein